MGGKLNETFEDGARRYLDRLDEGASVREALDAGQDVVHHPAVIAAATEMLATDGAIDMKQLALNAGISRASLYRYYPDRQQVEGEIAALALETLVVATAGVDDPSDRLQIAADHLIANPAHAAAVLPLMATVPVEVVARSAELILGDSRFMPWLIGIAAMAAAAHRAGDSAALTELVAAAVEQLRDC